MTQAKLSSYFGISCASGSSSNEQHTQLNDHQRDDDLEETENMDENIEDDEQSIEHDVTETTDEMDTELVEGTTDNDDGNFLPLCWNKSIWANKKKQYPWLICKNSKLGCLVCQNVSSLGVHTQKSIHISQEWKSVSIAPSGESKEKQLMSIRNKIKKHVCSQAHREAERINLQSEKDVITKFVLLTSQNSLLLKKSNLVQLVVCLILGGLHQASVQLKLFGIYIVPYISTSLRWQATSIGMQRKENLFKEWRQDYPLKLLF